MDSSNCESNFAYLLNLTIGNEWGRISSGHRSLSQSSGDLVAIMNGFNNSLKRKLVKTTRKLGIQKCMIFNAIIELRCANGDLIQKLGSFFVFNFRG
jgi:hypothetical protein